MLHGRKLKTDRLANILRHNLYRGYPRLELYLGLKLLPLLLAFKLRIMNGVTTVENPQSTLFAGLCIDTKLTYLHFVIKPSWMHNYNAQSNNLYLHLFSSLSSILSQSLRIVRPIVSELALCFSLSLYWNMLGKYISEHAFFVVDLESPFLYGPKYCKGCFI
jgi:hypothetical protein